MLSSVYRGILLRLAERVLLADGSTGREWGIGMCADRGNGRSGRLKFGPGPVGVALALAADAAALELVVVMLAVDGGEQRIVGGDCCATRIELATL